MGAKAVSYTHLFADGGFGFSTSALTDADILLYVTDVVETPDKNNELDVYKRQAFRCSLGNYYCEVERLIRCEGFTAYQVLINSECAVVLSRE